MRTAELPVFVSVEEYLMREERAFERSEYINGWVRAIAGATVRHNRIVSNLLIHCGMHLRGQPCKPYNSDMKIRVRQFGSTRFYYPDLTIVCESNSPTDVFQDQPILVAEVLSPSTRAIDFDEKLTAYLTIPSMQYYLLVEQDRATVVMLRRIEDGFLREVFDGLEASIVLPRFGMALPLSEIYLDVDLTNQAS